MMQPEEESTPVRNKPFNCNVEGCNYGCDYQSDLAKHSLKHTGVKPHKCDHCDVKFTQKSSLNLHIRKFHSESDENAAVDANESKSIKRKIKEEVNVPRKRVKYEEQTKSKSLFPKIEVKEEPRYSPPQDEPPYNPLQAMFSGVQNGFSFTIPITPGIASYHELDHGAIYYVPSGMQERVGGVVSEKVPTLDVLFAPETIRELQNLSSADVQEFDEYLLGGGSGEGGRRDAVNLTAQCFPTYCPQEQYPNVTGFVAAEAADMELGSLSQAEPGPLLSDVLKESWAITFADCQQETIDDPDQAELLDAIRSIKDEDKENVAPGYTA